MSKFLFLFTITPVQSFIAQARKTSDLFSGSKLLSSLCFKGTETLKQITEGSTNIIFPDIKSPSIPNRFMAIINKSEESLPEIGKQVETAVAEELNLIYNSILEKLKIDNSEASIKQLNNYFSYFWSFIPFEGDEYNREDYSRIEKTLGSIKNVRRFFQNTEKGRKCSLCGDRNALYYRPADTNKNKERKKPPYISDEAIEITGKDAIRFNPNEGLCAICLLKRNLNKADLPDKYKPKDDFPSTASIALMETLYKINPETRIKIVNYRKIFDEFISDDQLLYEENLRKEYFLKSGYQSRVSSLNEIIKAYKVIAKELSENGLKLSKYYALMLFDGDNIGKWLSGKYFKEEKSLQSFHIKLSGELSKFAREVEDEIIKPPFGKTIYAGGEDFMGFLNLNHLFNRMITLYNRFVSLDLSMFSDKKMTFSAGVVIAHYKTPLNEVISRAREMERKAKEIDADKNAFSIAVCKRSGETHEISYHWIDDENNPVPETFNAISEELKRGYFSNNFVFQLSREFKPLLAEKMKIPEIDSIVKTELLRLIKRSCKIKKMPEESFVDYKKRKNEKISDMFASVSRLYEATGTNKLQKLISALNIIEFISRELNNEN